MSPARTSEKCAERQRIVEELRVVQLCMTEISERQVEALMHGDLESERLHTLEWNNCRERFGSLIDTLRAHIAQHHCSGRRVQ